MRQLPIWENVATEARLKIRYWVPGAAMDPEDVVRDIQEIHKMGYGGVEVVSLNRQGTPENAWGSERWKMIVDVIARTTQELGMSMDLANGPAWPIAMPQITDADDPAALVELTYGELFIENGCYEGPLPERKKQHDAGTPELIACMAYQLADDHVLIRESYTDLMPLVKEGQLKIELEGSNWMLFAFYQQPAAHMVRGTYVIDHFSKAGAQACIDYWEPIFKNNPQPTLESLFCDSLEYNVEMEWSRNMAEEFEKLNGYSVLPHLPVCGLDGTFPENNIPGYSYTEKEISDAINNDYLETVTRCYCEQHLQILEEFAEQYGKSIRYQVAYNKVMEIERAGLYVGIPENEGLGRTSMDHLKTMAASVHLGRKRRHSFECAAEFGNGYGQSYDDLLWWVKRALMGGINSQVLHGGSYSGRYNGELPGVWPGYEGFGRAGGVSNNWNRTPDMEHARGCTDTIARMNAVFQLPAKIDIAVFRNAYLNNGWGGDGTHLYPDGGALMHAGYSYEFLSPALLQHPNAVVTNGRMDEQGAAYKALIIPPVKKIGIEALQSIKLLLEKSFPVLWVGEKPNEMMYYHELDQKAEWKELLNAVWDGCAHVESLPEVPEQLRVMDVKPDTALRAEVPVMAAHHVAPDGDYHMIYHYNILEYAPEKAALPGASNIFDKDTQMPFYDRGGEETLAEVEVAIEGCGSLWLCDPWSGAVQPLNCVEQDGLLKVSLPLREDDMAIILRTDDTGEAETAECDTCQSHTVEIVDIQLSNLALEAFAPDRSLPFWDCGYAAPVQYEIEGPVAFNDVADAYKKWSGRGTYAGSFAGVKNGKWILQLPEVCDTFTVKVNGKETVFPDQVMKRVDISELVCEGENRIEITVVTNMYNDLVHPVENSPFPMPYWPKTYGMWETESKKLHLKHIKG